MSDSDILVIRHFREKNCIPIFKTKWPGGYLLWKITDDDSFLFLMIYLVISSYSEYVCREGDKNVVYMCQNTSRHTRTDRGRLLRHHWFGGNPWMPRVVLEPRTSSSRPRTDDGWPRRCDCAAVVTRDLPASRRSTRHCYSSRAAACTLDTADRGIGTRVTAVVSAVGAAPGKPFQLPRTRKAYALPELHELSY